MKLVEAIYITSMLESRARFKFDSVENNFLDVIKLMYLMNPQEQLQFYMAGIRTFSELCLVFI